MNKITTRLSAIILIIIVAFSVLSVTANAGSDGVSGKDIASYARSLAGSSYVRGGKGPNSFDCSGFVYYVYKHFGISMPASSSAYFNSPSSYGKVVSASEAQPGDIVSWNGHVAIYLGNNSIIHAATPAKGVCVMNDLRRFVKNGVRNPKHHFIRVVGGTSSASSASVAEKSVSADPEIYKFKTGRSTYEEGNKVKLTANGDNYDSCEISIFRDSELVKNVTVKNGSYLFSADVAGEYSASCVLTSKDSDKTAKSKKITFKVEEKKETEQPKEAEITTEPVNGQAQESSAEIKTDAVSVKTNAETKKEKSEPQKINAVGYGTKVDVKTVTSQLAAVKTSTTEKKECNGDSRWLALALMFGIWF